MRPDLLFINTGYGPVAVAGERIMAMGQDAPETAPEVIDCQGKWLLPGGVDAHTHVGLQAGSQHVCDGWFHGSQAALAGGTTSIIEHISFDPDCSPQAALERAWAEAQGQCCCDYGLHGVVQRLNHSLTAALEQEKSRGVVSWKAYTTYDYAIAGAQLKQLLAACAAAGVLLTLHCEDDALLRRARQKLLDTGRLAPSYHPLARPAAAEAQAVAAALSAARQLGDAPLYIVHLSCQAALDQVRQARQLGQQNIYVETCPQYLLLDDSVYQQGTAAALEEAMSPPLRGAADREALWQGLSDGSIDVLATDHCRFSLAQKRLGQEDLRLTPNGAPGVEERLTLLLSQGVQSGRISLERAIDLLSAAPARIFGLRGKGRLAPGFDADLVLFDPQAACGFQAESLHGAGEYSLYRNQDLRGRVEAVWLRGRRVYDRGRVTAPAGLGNYLRREL